LTVASTSPRTRCSAEFGLIATASPIERLTVDERPLTLTARRAARGSPSTFNLSGDVASLHGPLQGEGSSRDGAERLWLSRVWKTVRSDRGDEDAPRDRSGRAGTRVESDGTLRRERFARYEGDVTLSACRNGAAGRAGHQSTHPWKITDKVKATVKSALAGTAGAANGHESSAWCA